MFGLAFITGFVLIMVVLLPFRFGKGGGLAASSSINSVETLRVLKKALIDRYIEEEQAARQSTLGRRAWEGRRQFLLNRYIDAARRLDYLEHLKTIASEMKQGSLQS